MVMNFTVFDTNLHMVNHYRRIHSAKSVVNTSTPRCYLSRPKSASSKSLTSRYSTPSVLSNYDLPSRTNSNCDCRRPKQNKNNVIPTERSSSVPPRPLHKTNQKFAPPNYLKTTNIKPKPVDNKSKNLSAKYLSAVLPKSVSALSPKSVSPKSTGSNHSSPKRWSAIKPDITLMPEHVNTKRPVPTPRTLSSKTKTTPKRKIVPDYEYLQFSLRITEDIIRNDLYSQKEMRRVFSSHIEANRGRLSMTKMLHHIQHLCKELNITKKVSSCVLTEKEARYCQTDSKQNVMKKINNGQYIIDEKEIQGMSEDELQVVISEILCEASCNSEDFDQESDDKLKKSNVNVEEIDCRCAPTNDVTNLNRQDNGDLLTTTNDSQDKQRKSEESSKLNKENKNQGMERKSDESLKCKAISCSCSIKEDTLDCSTCTVKDAVGDKQSLNSYESETISSKSSCICSIKEDTVDCSTTCLFEDAVENQQHLKIPSEKKSSLNDTNEPFTEPELGKRNCQLMQAEAALKNVLSLTSSKCCSTASQTCLNCAESAVKSTNSISLTKLISSETIIKIQEPVKSKSSSSVEEKEAASDVRLDTQLEQQATKSTLSSENITQISKQVDTAVSIHAKHVITTDSSIHYNLIDVEKFNQSILKLGVDKFTQTSFSVEKVQFIKSPSSSNQNLTGKCNEVEFACMPPPIIALPKSDTCKNTYPISRNVEKSEYQSIFEYLNHVYSRNATNIEQSNFLGSSSNKDGGKSEYKSAFEYTRTNIEQSSHLPKTSCPLSNKDARENDNKRAFEYTKTTNVEQSLNIPNTFSNKDIGESEYKNAYEYTRTTNIEQSSNIPTTPCPLSNNNVAKSDYKNAFDSIIVETTCLLPNTLNTFPNKDAGTTEYKSAFKNPRPSSVESSNESSQSCEIPNKNSDIIMAIKKLTSENVNALSEIMHRHPYISNSNSGIDKYKMKRPNSVNTANPTSYTSSAKPAETSDLVNSKNTTLSEGEICVCPSQPNKVGPPSKQYCFKENDILARLKKYEKQNLPENTQNERRDLQISNYELRSTAGRQFRCSCYFPNSSTQTSFNNKSQMLDKYSLQKQNGNTACSNCTCGEDSLLSDGEMMNSENYDDDTTRSTSPNT